MYLYEKTKCDFPSQKLGDTFGPYFFELEVQNTEDDTAFDWTGAEIIIQIKNKQGSKTELFSKTVSVTDLGEGKAQSFIELSVSEQETIGLEPGIYYYDIKIIMPAGERYTIYDGKIPFKYD